VAIQPENPGTGSSPVQTDRGELRHGPADLGPSGPSGPPAAVASFPGPSAAGHGRWRFGLILAALVLGLAGLTASAAGIAVQILPRRFNAAQQQQIMAWESARHWRVLSAGKIFPATVSYEVPGYALGADSMLPLTAHRVGIARQASCGRAASPAAATVLDRLGCAKMLRATYLDATGSLVVTIGVAVMPGQAAAEASIHALPSQQGVQSGVKPLAYPNTLTAGFGEAQRQLTKAISMGPYLILSAAGFTDGRPLIPGSSDYYDQEEMTSLVNGVASAVGGPLGMLPPLPRCPGAPGC
jgi:hypothetical protein